jgi:hypothetical protein
MPVRKARVSHARASLDEVSSKQQIESIELTADLTLEKGRQRTAIARLQLVEPLASIAMQRLVAGTGSPPPPLGYAQAG